MPKQGEFDPTQLAAATSIPSPVALVAHIAMEGLDFLDAARDFARDHIFMIYRALNGNPQGE